MSLDTVIDVVCDKRNINREILMGKSKANHVSLTRYMLWHFLHCSMGVSAGKLSRIFDRNIPSIFRGIRIMRHYMKYYKDIQSEYLEIAEAIGNRSVD